MAENEQKARLQLDKLGDFAKVIRGFRAALSDDEAIRVGEL